MKTIAILLGLFCTTAAFGEIAAEDKPADTRGNESLATAITSSNWSWEETTIGTKRVEEIQFYQDGVAGNSRFLWKAHWEVAGSRILVLENTSRGARFFGRKAYLVFDAEFTHFIGIDFNGRTTVEGFRREAVDPKRQTPEAKAE